MANDTLSSAAPVGQACSCPREDRLSGWIDRRAKLSQRGKLEVTTWFHRYWTAALPAGEFQVASFIFGRTILWGRLVEAIWLRHFKEGVYETPGLPFEHEDSVRRLLRSLRRRGAIWEAFLSKADPRYHRLVARYGLDVHPNASKLYALNLDWEPFHDCEAPGATRCPEVEFVPEAQARGREQARTRERVRQTGEPWPRAVQGGRG